MRNLFLMALFGLFMFAGITTQQGVAGFIATPAFAGGESDNKDSGNSSESKDSNSNDSGSKDNKDSSSNDSGSKDSSYNDSSSNDGGSKDSNDGGNDSSSNDSNSDDQASNDDTTAFRCPTGITTCYRSDGTEYEDLNNLPPSAAGSSGGASSGPALVPSHMRSF